MDSMNIFCCFDEYQDDGASLFDPSKPPIFDSEFDGLFDPSKPPIFDEEYEGFLGSFKEELSQGTNLVVHLGMGEIARAQIWSDNVIPCCVIPMVVLSRRFALFSHLDVRLFGFETLNNYYLEFSDFGETFASCEASAFHEFVIQDGVLVKGIRHCIPKQTVLELSVHESLGERQKVFWHKRMLRIRSTRMRLGIGGCSSWLLVCITRFASLFVVLVFDPGKIRYSILYAVITVLVSSINNLASENSIASKCVDKEIVLTACIFEVLCSKAHKSVFFLLKF